MECCILFVNFVSIFCRIFVLEFVLFFVIFIVFIIGIVIFSNLVVFLFGGKFIVLFKVDCI